MVIHTLFLPASCLPVVAFDLLIDWVNYRILNRDRFIAPIVAVPSRTPLLMIDLLIVMQPFFTFFLSCFGATNTPS